MTDGTPNSRHELNARWLDPARLTKATVILSLVILAALLIALLHPDSAPNNQKVFGELATKVGLSLRPLVILIVCIVWLPLPIAFWHLSQILLRSASEGGSLSKLGIVRSIFVIPGRHPDLKVSRLVVLLVLGGYIVAILTCAYIADERDSQRKRSEIQTR
ncbi:MAG TPA: hypothetical protein DDZ88_27990 [Verrucomicrobiales bacterium]|nr:hypothetical protein [Verrucomicrobiales bacterium]